MEKKYGNSKILPAAALIIGAAGFISILYLIVTNGQLFWDDPVREWFYSIRQPGLTTLMCLITYLGEWYSVVVVLLLLLIYPKTRKTLGVPAFFAVLLTQLIKTVVKPIVCRPRPDVSLHLIEQGGWSFPSGHAITSMALYGIIFLLLICYMREGRPVTTKKAPLICCAFLAVAIGLSRIYLGVHYPSDVAAGWFAAASVVGLIFLCRPLIDRLNLHIPD